MKTKSGASIQIIGYKNERSVNVKIIAHESAPFSRLTLADFEEVFEQLKADLPWITREEIYLLQPTGEFGSHPGFVFVIPEDKAIPDYFKMY